MKAPIFAIACLLLACASACTGPPTRLRGLTLDQKAAQVLLIGVEGRGQPSTDSLALLEALPVGGILLFGLNLPSRPAELADYTAALQDAVARGAKARGSEAPPLIVAIDHEGGSVFRFKGSGITRIPPPLEVGREGPRYAALLGRAAGSELRALGVNMALAPVVELLCDQNEAFLGTRSYGRDAKRVDASAGGIQGLQAEGVAAVAKHFPGNAGEDPHLVLPRLGVSRAEYERDYRPRFASAIRNRVSSVMLSHVVFEALDPDRPASLSPRVAEAELRGRLGFKGLAITDDLCMRALSHSTGAELAAVEALQAGADLLMLADMRAAPRVRDAIVKAVEAGRITEARLDEAAGRVLELKARFKMASDLDPGLRARRRAEYPSLVEEAARRLRGFAPAGGQGKEGAGGADDQ